MGDEGGEIVKPPPSANTKEGASVGDEGGEIVNPPPSANSSERSVDAAAMLALVK